MSERVQGFGAPANGCHSACQVTNLHCFDAQLIPLYLLFHLYLDLITPTFAPPVFLAVCYVCTMSSIPVLSDTFLNLRPT